MAGAVVPLVRRASGWSIALGVVMIILGFVCMMAPLAAGILIVYIVAWSAIFNGVSQLLFAFRAHSGGRIALEIILGLAYIVAGVYLLMHPGGGLLAITLLLGSILMVYGVFALVLAFQLRPHPGWGWMLFDAIVTILLGILIWGHWPLNSAWVVGTLFGISILVSGVSRLMFSLAVRRLASAVP